MKRPAATARQPDKYTMSTPPISSIDAQEAADAGRKNGKAKTA
jgi:hypothetical protein